LRDQETIERVLELQAGARRAEARRHIEAEIFARVEEGDILRDPA